jgi:hypothetical protein
VSRVAWAWWVPWLAACGGFDPDVGGFQAARCVDADSDPSRDVSFNEDVLPLLRGETEEVGCTCHVPTAMDPVGFSVTGFDVSTYASLRRGGATSGAAVVVAGAPCDSILWQKTGPAPPFGARMPFDGPPFWSDVARRLVADWIAEGAQND